MALEIPGSPGITAATFMDAETVAVAITREDGTIVVRAVPIGGTLADGRDLFELPDRTTSAVALPDRIISLVADPTGNHFLAVVASGGLYRWSRGEEAPTKVADEVTAAVWLP
jgi:hypothetical protein